MSTPQKFLQDVVNILEINLKAVDVPCVKEDQKEGIIFRVGGGSVFIKVSGTFQEPKFEVIAMKADLDGKTTLEPGGLKLTTSDFER